MDEDGSRYLLGDAVGNLLLLVLQVWAACASPAALAAAAGGCMTHHLKEQLVLSRWACMGAA